VGLWDPGAITNEDAELNQRILDGGGQIYLSRDIVVHYFPRDSFKTLAKQYFKYGRGRARTLLKLGSFPTLRPALPFLMTTGAAAMVVLPPLWPLAPLAFATYALITGAEAVRVSGKLGPAAVPLVWAMFPVLHLSHGIGFAAGLVQYSRKPDWPEEPERVGPRKAHLRAV
jgi:succinoglycan biosynthesis protein ExoA